MSANNITYLNDLLGMFIRWGMFSTWRGKCHSSAKLSFIRDWIDVEKFLKHNIFSQKAFCFRISGIDLLFHWTTLQNFYCSGTSAALRLHVFGGFVLILRDEEPFLLLINSGIRNLLNFQGRIASLVIIADYSFEKRNLLAFCIQFDTIRWSVWTLF